MAIDSLVHSSPTSPSGNEDAANARRPPIEKYFTHLSVARDDEWNRSRRRRSADEGNARVGDRVYSYSKPPGNP